jgi:hypothetical protein
MDWKQFEINFPVYFPGGTENKRGTAVAAAPPQI